MNVLEILEQKRQDIIMSGSARCSVDELNVIGAPAQLRTLKMCVPMPDNFVRSSGLDDCVKFINEGDCIYRVLEYCMLTNPVLDGVSQYVKRFNR